MISISGKSKEKMTFLFEQYGYFCCDACDGMEQKCSYLYHAQCDKGIWAKHTATPKCVLNSCHDGNFESLRS